MKPTNPDSIMCKKVAIGRPMEVMCANCGDVMQTTVVKASIPCWKNWCCRPCGGTCCLLNILMPPCSETIQYEHYCSNCGICLAVCEKYKPPGCCDQRLERHWPDSFGVHKV